MNQDPSSRPSSAKLPLKLKTAKIAFSVVPYGEASKTPPPVAATPTINSSRSRNSNCIKHDLTKFQNESDAQEEQQLHHHHNMSSTSNISFLSPITTTQEKAFAFSKKIEEFKNQHTTNSNQTEQTDDQDDVLLFFKNVLKDSLDKATKISLQPNSGSDIEDGNDNNNSSFRSSINDQHVKYERAKQEAAVASVAVLEGLVDLLRRRISLQTVKPKRRASSTVSLFRGLNENDEKHKDLDGQNYHVANDNNHGSNLSFLISVADTLEASILGLKAIILPTLAHDDRPNAASAPTSFFEKRFNVALQKNLISENIPVSLIESTKQRMKTYHRSLFSPHLYENQQASSVLTPEIASRIQNCDRMLELLRKKKRFSAKNSLQRQNNSNSSLGDSSSANLSSLLTTRTNPWADAEDALHVLRLRFVFHLWKIFSKCERQRRMNSFRCTQKLSKERAKVQILHTFLSFKRSQTQSSVLAAKNAIKENQILLKKVGEAEDKVRRATQQVEQVNFMYRNSLTEIEELSDKIEESERTPMILDFRRPIRDTVSGELILEGILEFRKTSHTNNFTNQKANNKRSSIIDIENEKSSPKEFYLYPPFVDWNCPQQNAHARDLLQLETIERLSEKKGIGIPGYQQPSSFYEIRVSQGFSCGVTDKMLNRNQHNNNIKNFISDCFASNFSTKRWDVEFVAFVNGILKKIILMNTDNNNNNNSIMSRINMRQKNKEIVESFNRARARRNTSAAFEKSTTNHPKKRSSNEDEEITVDMIGDDADANFEWDINEPFAMQLVHREYFGIVIPSSVTSTLLLNRSMSMKAGNNKMPHINEKKIDFGNDIESDSSSSFQDEEEEKEGEEEEEIENDLEEKNNKHRVEEQVPKKGDSFLGSFLFSKKNLGASSAQNNFVTIPKKKQARNTKNPPKSVEVLSPPMKSFSKSNQNSSFRNRPAELEKAEIKQEELSQRHHETPASPLDLLVESIITASLAKLKETVVSRNRQLSEETENFVRTSTENILEMNRVREERNEKPRKDLVKSPEDAETSSAGNENRKYANKQKILSTNFCPVATASATSSSSICGWEISSLSELITNPEVSLQLLTIIFGKLAITKSLRNYFRENHDEANEFHVFITFQKNNNSNVMPFFNKVVSILVNDLLFSNQTDYNEQDSPMNSLRAAFSSIKNDDDFVAVGRTLCVLLQQHLIFTMSEQEKQCRKIESNSLMFRRLLKASSLKR